MGLTYHIKSPIDISRSLMDFPLMILIQVQNSFFYITIYHIKNYIYNENKILAINNFNNYRN